MDCISNAARSCRCRLCRGPAHLVGRLLVGPHVEQQLHHSSAAPLSSVVQRRVSTLRHGARAKPRRKMWLGVRLARRSTWHLQARCAQRWRGAASICVWPGVRERAAAEARQLTLGWALCSPSPTAATHALPPDPTTPCGRRCGRPPSSARSLPTLSAASLLAPAFSSSSTTSSWPPPAAQWSGVHPFCGMGPGPTHATPK